VACVNIPRIIYIGNTSPRLQAHLAPSCDYKEGSGCAFFLCHKAQRCSSLPSLHRVQLFSDDVSGLFHHLEIGPAYLGHLQAILDQVPAGPFDHPGRYGGTCCQIGSGYASSRHIGTGNAHTARQRHTGPLAGGAQWPCAGDPWQRVCCAWATSAQGVCSPRSWLPASPAGAMSKPLSRCTPRRGAGGARSCCSWPWSYRTYYWS
jgi:hypothetical protein